MSHVSLGMWIASRLAAMATIYCRGGLGDTQTPICLVESFRTAARRQHTSLLSWESSTLRSGLLRVLGSALSRWTVNGRSIHLVRSTGSIYDRLGVMTPSSFDNFCRGREGRAV